MFANEDRQWTLVLLACDLDRVPTIEAILDDLCIRLGTQVKTSWRVPRELAMLGAYSEDTVHRIINGRVEISWISTKVESELLQQEYYRRLLSE